MSRLLMLLLIGIALHGKPANADDWGPWEAPAVRQSKLQPADNGPLQLAVRLFQKYISPVDGPRCPMYPTCSSYSLQALRKHGPLLGTFFTVDRLYREGDPHEHDQPINKWGHIRFADPLSRNDFWLNEK